MCGIHGILDLTGAPAPVEALSRMGQVTRHRGPDDEGTHQDGALGIGMRRVSVIDVAGGQAQQTPQGMGAIGAHAAQVLLDFSPQ